MIQTLFKSATRRARRGCQTLAVLLLAACALPAAAAIAASERAVLQALYNSTSGDGWTLPSPMPAGKLAWKTTPGGAFQAVGTECQWIGISCSADGIHVTMVNLPAMNLVGTLPSTAPTALNQLTALKSLTLNNNQLTGAIPSLTGLAALEHVDIRTNRLTGPLPSLTGLTALKGVFAAFNDLSGPIPPLSGLTALNNLTINNNRLSGPIPSLSGLKALSSFLVSDNQLTGSIPDLSTLTSLSAFVVSGNQLTGTIHPSISGLTSLRTIHLGRNQLSGPVPAAPPNLVAGMSSLCPNDLTPSTSPAWNAATGSTPWSSRCRALPPEPARNVTAVPTLGEWSLMLLGLLAAGLGARRLRPGR